MLVLFGVAHAAATGPHLDTIVFSAQRHVLLDKVTEDGRYHKISCPTEAAHLYVIRPGKRMTRLTSGSSDDFAPQYSRSKAGVLFVRHSKTNHLMLLPNGSTKPKTLSKFPPGMPKNSVVSASGRTYLVSLSENGLAYGGAEKIVCVFDGVVVKQFGGLNKDPIRGDHLGRYQIIPGTETVYVQLNDNSSFFFDCLTRKLAKTWPSDHIIFWQSPDRAYSIDSDDDTKIIVYDRKGNKTSKIKPDLSAGTGMGPRDLLPQAEWIQAGSLIIEDENHISDGIHPSCYRLNLITGKVTSMFEGEWLDTNDRGEFLSISWEWIGDYKRGNHRTGFLHRSDKDGKHERQISDYPYDVTSACWWTG